MDYQQQISLLQQQIRNMSLLVTDLLRKRNEKLVTAESLTGGMLSSSIVTHPGTSSIMEGGIVAYQDHVKSEFLGVPRSILDDPHQGAVSEACALYMCDGALHQFLKATYAVSTTGFAGPSGYEIGKVFIAIVKRGNAPEQKVCYECHFTGDRDIVRMKTTLTALLRLYELLVI